MNIAIIPARGGSKRIPRKNIRMFAGKPMIAHAITAAKSSGLFDHLIASTDDIEIAKIAREWGAETPFLRPPELADDHIPTVPVIAHAINACEGLGWYMDFVCCIYPCVPLIQIEDLRGALNLLTVAGADYCFPVAEFQSSVQRALKRNETGKMSPLYPQYELSRSQDLELAYHDVGQFYWGTRQAWLTNRCIHSSGAGFPIPSWRVVDIDTPEDWARAEAIYTAVTRKH